MVETSGAITDVARATTGTSNRSRSEIAVTAGLVIGTILAEMGMDLEDFGWWSREVLTGFPEFRRKIRRGWNTHKHEYL